MLALLLTACGNPCMDLCQRHEVYLDECGYGWPTGFAEEGWASIEDCYEDQAEASDEERDACAEELSEPEQRSCY